MDDGLSAHTDIKWQGNVGVAQYGGGDQGQVVLFYIKPIHNPAKSTEEGRPIYTEAVFVKIHPPGERFNIIDRPVKDSDRKRWPQQWALFQQNKEQIPEGTPIGLLYPDHPAVESTLRAHGVFTIEMCAELSGIAIENIGMGAQRYVNDSKKYLEAAKKGVSGSQMRRELEERDREIASLKHTQSLMQAELAQMRELTQRGMNMTTADFHRLTAGGQQRPVFPNEQPRSQHFDPQAAQIAATHPTADLAKAKPKRRARINR